MSLESKRYAIRHQKALRTNVQVFGLASAASRSYSDSHIRVPPTVISRSFEASWNMAWRNVIAARQARIPRTSYPRSPSSASELKALSRTGSGQVTPQFDSPIG